MHALTKRVARLEQAGGDMGRRIIVSGPHGMDTGEALRQLGIEVTAADTVVYLSRFTGNGAPRLVSISPVGSQA